jgi:hypothetical protein
MHTSLLIQLRGYSPLQRCGVCIVEVVPRGNVRPLEGSSHFLHSGFVHISADYPAATASLRNGVLLPMPASSGLSIHGAGESNCRVGAAPRINRGVCLSQVLRRTEETLRNVQQFRVSGG